MPPLSITKNQVGATCFHTLTIQLKCYNGDMLSGLYKFSSGNKANIFRNFSLLYINDAK